MKIVNVNPENSILEVGSFKVQLPKIEAGEVVVLEGRGPIWAYGLYFHALHGSPAGAVGVYDPKLGGAVIVSSHVKGIKEGEIYPIS